MTLNSAAKNEVKQRTLEETPARALEFLMGVSSSAGLFNVLRMRGYTSEEQLKGWQLLQESGAPLFEENELDARTPASQALSELDNTDEQVFRLVRAALENGFGDCAQVVLDGIGPSQGSSVVLNMSRLLERLDTLDASKKEMDKKAMAKLADRGIDKVERTRLLGLVEQAKSLPAVKMGDAKKDAVLLDRHLESLRRLRSWYTEWSEVARATVERRDYLIRLGLASRRKSGAGVESEPADESKA